REVRSMRRAKLRSEFFMGFICFSKREVEGIFADYFGSAIVNDDGMNVFQRIVPIPSPSVALLDWSPPGV
ncbi:MAG: hypothetical protein RR857_11925, partial [Comamonas sp.]